MDYIAEVFSVDKIGYFGLFMMLVIAGLGLLALVFFWERVLTLFGRCNVDKDRFMANVKSAVLAGDLNSAVNYCNDKNAPINNVVKAGLTAVLNKGSTDDIQTSMDVAALREVPKVERGTPFLSLFANIATLMGLLTTIVGLVQGFSAVKTVDPAQKATMLADGIAVAMNGTAFGLLVAIPCLLGFAFLSAKTQRILDDLHEVSVSILNLIIQNKEKFSQ